jgi:predicted Zn-dependent peptidase
MNELPVSPPSMTNISTLANGLRVVSHHMPHVETTSLGVYVGVGARHETKDQQGLSHLLEHMAFKGTATRTAMAIAEEIEQVGGEINAATSLETTAYYARVLRGDEGLALDILADIIQNSTFDPTELARERDVILQEIAATQDSPDEIAYDLFQDAAFPDQPVGRPILGTPESVTRATADDLKGFLAQRYVPSQIVVSAAGAVNHDHLLRHATALFGSLGNTPTAPEISAEEPARYSGGARSSTRSFEQSHVLLGFEGPSYRAPTTFTAQVFSGLFGGGMSSRLFQEVREKRGLCYSIYASAWGLKDSGMFQIHASTGHAMVHELIDVIGSELEKVADIGPTEREVSRAKAQLKAGLLMSLESSGARAEQMARHLMVHNRLISAEELITRVDDVSVASVRAFAASLASSTPSVAVVGAGKKSAAFAKRAEVVMGRGGLAQNLAQTLAMKAAHA